MSALKVCAKVWIIIWFSQSYQERKMSKHVSKTVYEIIWFFWQYFDEIIRIGLSYASNFCFYLKGWILKVKSILHPSLPQYYIICHGSLNSNKNINFWRNMSTFHTLREWSLLFYCDWHFTLQKLFDLRKLKLCHLEISQFSFLLCRMIFNIDWNVELFYN